MSVKSLCFLFAIFYSIVASADTLTESRKVTASRGAGIDLFGSSIAVDDNTLMVGATRDDNLGDSGSLYIYTRDANGNWGNETRLTASDADLNVMSQQASL